MHTAQPVSLVYVAATLTNKPPPHTLLTSTQDRSDVAVGWTVSYETLSTHGDDVPRQTRSDDMVGGSVS